MPKIFTGKATVLNDLIKNVMKLAQQAERISLSAAGVGSAFSSVCELVCSFFRALIGRQQTRWREVHGRPWGEQSKGCVTVTVGHC